MKTISKEYFFYISWITLSFLFIIFAIVFEGTGGNGDSLLHYMYAKYAWLDHSLFFNHWGKPVFTIISSPFAQFGFTGIKIFNVLASSFSVLFAYKIAKRFNLTYSHLIFIPIFAAPLFFKVMFSGLTEPFSAFILSAFLYTWVVNKRVTAITIISFIPFIRSEGLIILGVVLVYLLWTKNWKYVPLLIVGHLVISLLGYQYNDNLLWVFNKIPYAKLSSVYGVGNWSHFVNQLYFCLGPLIYFLLIIGLIKMLAAMFTPEKRTDFFNEKLFLVYGIFIAFFIAHTMFWALGIFNSMGLNRVFVTVFPLIALICLEGLGFITQNFSVKIKKIVAYTISLLIVIFTCLSNPASINFKEDLLLDEGMKTVKEKVVPYLETKYPTKTYMSGDISIAFYSNRNVFNPNDFLMIYNTKPHLLKDTNFVFIWDPWFARVEGGLDLEILKNSTNLKGDTTFKLAEKEGDHMEYIIFKKE